MAKKTQQVKRPTFYKLADGGAEPIEAAEWLEWCEATNGGKEDLLGSGDAEVAVDTIFLGIDRQLKHDGPPLLFETIILGGPHDGEAWLSATYEDAGHRHEEACQLIGFELPPRLRLIP